MKSDHYAIFSHGKRLVLPNMSLHDQGITGTTHLHITMSVQGGADKEDKQGDKPKSKSKSKQEEKSSALAKGSSSRTDGHKPNSKEKEPKLMDVCQGLPQKVDARALFKEGLKTDLSMDFIISMG
ncbi:uncharacterized protein LOC134179640 [Corticium candelabrum]|uniref:uncharacterized protein LOC134179640 n=1 Tax=Corticium candelabrum TaxID=121492 RepID=UPI002E25BD8F|nr:uncharacterized protein LOC134179640 [Corticium candelabrum]